MLRAIALKLACIHPEDKEWILGQLSSTEQATIQLLLEEIQTLGLATLPLVADTALAELKQTPVKEQTNKYDATNLDKFWQHVLISDNNQDRFQWILNSEIAERSVAPMQAVPPKLFALVQDYAERKIYELIN